MRTTSLAGLLSVASSVLAVQTSVGIRGVADLSATNETVIPKRFIIEVAKVGDFLYITFLRSNSSLVF